MNDSRVAIICLAPAAGHLIPLLKIASACRQRAEAVVIVPDELKHVAQYYGFHAEGFGRVQPEDGELALQAYIHASEPARVMGQFNRMRKKFFFPYYAAVRSSLARVDAILTRFRPTCILADDAAPHFRRELDLLSVQHSVPILLHDSTLHHNTWSHRSCYSYGVSSFLHDAFDKTRNEALLFFRGREPSISFADIDPLECLPAIRLPMDRNRVTYLTSGTRFLERCLLGDSLLKEAYERLVLPTMPPLDGDLAPDLVSWLNDSESPVVYITLGTIIDRSKNLAHIVQTVLQSGKRALVHGNAPEIAEIVGDDVRHEGWLPQNTVMAHPAVVLVISHAGSGSVEEAWWNGKPLVCIPHAWDQYYNAWVASRFGAAVCVTKDSRALRQKLRTAIQEATREPCKSNAQGISRAMRSCWQATENCVLGLFRTSA